MSLGILGKKVGMTRVFDAEAGCMIPVTVVDVNGNELLQVKTTETDATQLFRSHTTTRRSAVSIFLSALTRQSKARLVLRNSLRSFASITMPIFQVRKRAIRVLLFSRTVSGLTLLGLQKEKVSKVT